MRELLEERPYALKRKSPLRKTVEHLTTMLQTDWSQRQKFALIILEPGQVHQLCISTKIKILRR
jgi:hypothetical protein